MLYELLEKNRSYRNYDASYEVSKEVLMDLVRHARITPSSVNRQVLKYYLAYTKEDTARIQPLTAWAKALAKEVPYPGQCPTAFIVIVQDTRLSSNMTAFLKDVGIVAQTMLLRAVELGLNGCMIGSIQKEKLKEVLRLDEHFEPMLVVAIGKAKENIVLEDAVDGQVGYYRDAQDVHHVPKRPLEELILPHK